MSQPILVELNRPGGFLISKCLKLKILKFAECVETLTIKLWDSLEFYRTFIEIYRCIDTSLLGPSVNIVYDKLRQ